MIIDTDVPMPRGDKEMFPSRGNRQSQYPFHIMDVGQSVFYPMNGANAIDKHPAYLAAATIQKRYKDYRFTGRTVTEDDVVGVRIWRVPATPAAPKPLNLPTLAQMNIRAN
jgi:hypothetical protein